MVLRNFTLRVDRKLISLAIGVGRLKHLTYLGIMVMALVLLMPYFGYFHNFVDRHGSKKYN